MVESKTNKSDIAILGGGPAGLATGVELKNLGIPATVFERAPAVGGLSRTEFRAGYRFDLGGHRFFTKKPELNAFLTDVLGDELLDVERVSHIYFQGKRFDYPLAAGNVLRNLHWWTILRAVFDFVYGQIRHRLRPRPLRTFEDWVSLKFGRTLFELFFRSYTEKVWGVSCQDISAEWAAQRIKGFDLKGAVLNALKPSSSNKHTTLVEQFRYPRLGYGRISHRMAEAIEAGGGTISCKSTVRKVHHGQQKITGLEIEQDGAVQTHAPSNVVSSIPLTVLCQLMEPPAPTEVLDAAKQLRFRSLIVIHVRVARERVTQDTWAYIQETQCKMGRIHEPKNWSDAMVDEPGHTSIVCEFFCAMGDELWVSSDEELEALAIDELSRILKLIDPSEVAGVDVVRVGGAYPVFFMGYEEPFETVRNYLEGFSNLQLVGRGGMYRYHNVDHVIETGVLAARNLAAGKRIHDVFEVNADDSYHEVVDDEDEIRVGTTP
jgi:protoporphyrinogen oxidase